MKGWTPMMIAQIPNKLETEWCDDVKAVWDKWKSFFLTLEEFSQAIMTNALEFARSHKAVAWIADASEAKGVFPQEIQDYISQQVFKAFAEIGIKYFISVQPKSAVSKLGVKRYESQLGPNGLELVEVATIEGAFAFLQERAKKTG
jgi:hypothetical protein